MYEIVTGSDGNTVIASGLNIPASDANKIARGIRETYGDTDVRAEKM
jgi:hypothetical protein